MAATIPAKEPDSVTAGDTLKFTKSLTDYLPADSWVLTYALVRPGVIHSITASDNGDGDHLVNVTAATTATWEPGEYRWQSYVTLAAERYQVGSGVITVLANLAALSAGGDLRTHAEQMFDGLKAAMLSGADTVTISYSVSSGGGSRQRTFESRAEIERSYRFWRGELRRERGARRVQVRF